MFLDQRFPTSISYGAVGGPGYSTNIITLSSGVEGRNQNWSTARCAYNAAKGCSTDQDKKDLIAFFRIAKGKANTFRWKDWSDYTASGVEGVFDHISGATYQFQKEYVLGSDSELRDIFLPIDVIIHAGATLLTETTNYTYDRTTGILTLVGSPGTPTVWTGSFDVLARFDTDTLQLVGEDFDYFKTQNIPIIEVRPS